MKTLQLFLSYLFVLLGGLLSYDSFLMYFEQIHSQDWQKHRGQIVSITIQKKRMFNMYEILVPHIFYRYQVGEDRYLSNKLSLDKWHFFGFKSVDSLFHLFPSGKKIDVYVNPKKASESVLEPGEAFNVYFPLILGLAIFGYGIRLLTRTLRDLLHDTYSAFQIQHLYRKISKLNRKYFRRK